ncbi:aldehyde dehydrogenase (NAD+) [Actinokineospora globicatena]|uniref:aldehyde dehydrogenase family protein n=1 Tax=Actinokineospora globicatena TaxID=103729 RepID=UPI0020A46036|nr:aldehyde dehydrogenase family protein [Actinokineospora globicatena]MCP2301037.1 aldehyde dehydrogenase (NAD+) [Actinokineospora globicatena]GLW77330.1 aldehyde dehydrogenase [Actinokineospora globicatena]GLW84164.1 aldehyde dehydrogenase [Actinokineospora globicatena]
MRIVSTSPQSPEDVVIDVPEGDAVGAVARARTAQREWAATGPAVRAAALDAIADAVAGSDLAQLIVREVGKPITEAKGEVARAVAIFRYYAQQAYDPIGETYPGGLFLTVRRPRGVAGLITPWNFPLAIPVWKAAPALAFGNAAVIKPSPDATACALRLAELVEGHLPEGLFAVVPGGADVGTALVDSADVVSFTGSGAVGRQVAIAAAGRGIPAQCEMGGLSAAIVLPDADLDRAAADIAYAAMGFAGQKCTATKRVIVVGSGTRDALLSAVDALRIGDPADPTTAVGPVISAAARDRVVAAGGSALDADGWFVRPTLVGPGTRLDREEVFGPIATITEVADADAAVALANATDYGLVTALYTADLTAALSYVERCESGLVKVNMPTAGVDFHLPFGGERGSGYGGKEQGKAAAAFYTLSRTVQLSR